MYDKGYTRLIMSIYCRKLLVLKFIDLSSLRTLIAVGKLNQKRFVIFGNSLIQWKIWYITINKLPMTYNIRNLRKN